MIHADIVVNHWVAARQERVGYVTVVWEARPDQEKAWLKEFTDHHDGTYLFVTEAHDADSCPFKDGDWLAMVKTPVNQDEYDFRLPEGDANG